MRKISSLKVNAILNVIKQCCMIVFPMITFPYASRILGAENYGKISFGNSIISYISLIAALGISNYAIREGARIKKEGESFRNFIDQLFTLNFCSMLVAYSLLFILITSWPKMNDYLPTILIQSLSVFFITIGLDWVNIIYEDYFYMTIRYIICQTIAIIFMFAFVKSSYDYNWYAFSTVLGNALANVVNIWHVYKEWHIYPKFKLSKDILQHLKSVLILFGTSIASLVYINSDITILGIMCNDVVVGYYSVSCKLYTLVKQLLNALLVVALPRISSNISEQNHEQLTRKLTEIFQYIILIVFPAAMGLGMLSGNIITIFTGQEYIRSADSLRILSISLIFAVIACFYINVIMLPFRMEAQILRSTVISAFTNIILNIVLIPYGEENAAAFTTLISEIIMCILGIWYTRSKFKFNVKKALLIAVFGMIWIFIECNLFLHILNSSILIIFMSILVGGLGYAFLLMWCYKDYILKFISSIRC